MNWNTVLTCRIGIDWLVLPLAEVSGLVDLILMYQTGNCLFKAKCLSRNMNV